MPGGSGSLHGRLPAAATLGSASGYAGRAEDDRGGVTLACPTNPCGSTSVAVAGSRRHSTAFTQVPGIRHDGPPSVPCSDHRAVQAHRWSRRFRHQCRLERNHGVRQQLGQAVGHRHVPGRRVALTSPPPAVRGVSRDDESCRSTSRRARSSRGLCLRETGAGAAITRRLVLLS